MALYVIGSFFPCPTARDRVKFLAGVSKTIAAKALATAFRVLY